MASSLYWSDQLSFKDENTYPVQKELWYHDFKVEFLCLLGCYSKLWFLLRHLKTWKSKEFWILIPWKLISMLPLQSHCQNWCAECPLDWIMWPNLIRKLHEWISLIIILSFQMWSHWQPLCKRSVTSHWWLGGLLIYLRTCLAQWVK